MLGHREDVPDLLVAADVVVFASLWEGFGAVLVEAHALGCPVVCSDLPVFREVLARLPSSDIHTIVPKKSPEQIADAVVSIVRSGDRREANPLGCFSIDRSTAAYGQLVRSLPDDR